MTFEKAIKILDGMKISPKGTNTCGIEFYNYSKESVEEAIDWAKDLLLKEMLTWDRPEPFGCMPIQEAVEYLNPEVNQNRLYQLACATWADAFACRNAYARALAECYRYIKESLKDEDDLK